MKPHQAGLLQRGVGDDEPAVARRVEVFGCRGRLLPGPGREGAGAEGRGGQQGPPAVGVDEHLLAFALERDGFHAGRGEEAQGLADVEQRGVLQAEPRGGPVNQRPQSEDVGRTVLQSDELAAVAVPTVGVGIDPVEAEPFARQVLFGRGGDHLDVAGAEPCEVFRGDPRQHGVALEGYHAAEAAAQEEGIDPETAGEVQHRVAPDALVCGAGLARGLLEGAWRQDALRRGIGRQLPLGPGEVLDLRGHQPGMRDAAVHGHLQRVAVSGSGYGPHEFGAAEQFVFFGSDHEGKSTLFFGSLHHVARVPAARSR